MAGYGGYEDAAKILSPEVYCFILNLDADNVADRLEFQLMPDGITENKAAMYNEVPIIGRSLPLIGYASSTSRMTALSLRFVALKEEGKYSPQWVEKQVRWLESKVYPHYRDGLTYPPSRLLLIIGRAIGMQCVMTSYNTSWNGPWTVKTGEASSFQATVDIQLQEYGQNLSTSGHPFDHDEAIEGRNQGSASLGTGEPFIQIPANIDFGFAQGGGG